MFLLRIAVVAVLCALPHAQGLPVVSYPAGNPRTSAKVLLGKALFWDEQLSSTRSVACGTCHILSAGSTDPRTFTDPRSMHPGPDAALGTPDDVGGSFGVPGNTAGGSYLSTFFGLSPQVTPRRTQSVIMAQYAPSLFWDGRATDSFADPVTHQILLPTNAALESQALGPLTSEVEMGHLGRTLSDVEVRIVTVRPLALASNIPAPLATFVAGRSYPDLFQLAFGSNQVTAARIAMAIATYERELVPDQTPFDLGTLSSVARGGQIVFTLGRCDTCHAPPLFTDNLFFNTGVRPTTEDSGRGGITGLPADIGTFRVPSLRNVKLRAPFLHNGRFRTLAEVVDFYTRGGDFPASNLSITPTGFSAQQKRDLVVFLEELTDPRVENELPPFDRPTLFSESSGANVHFGHGTPGDGGIVPEAIAVEPAVLGNDRFTLGFDKGAAGSPVWLVFGFNADPVGLPLLGITFHLVPGPDVIGFQAGTTGGSAPGEGRLSFTFRVPTAPSLRGVTLNGQWIQLNFASPSPFSATAGFGFTLL